MEKDLVDVILEVFNKVFHIQFDHKKHILMYLIDDAILNIEGDKKFRIKVANSNVMFLEKKSWNEWELELRLRLSQIPPWMEIPV